MGEGDCGTFTEGPLLDSDFTWLRGQLTVVLSFLAFFKKNTESNGHFRSVVQVSSAWGEGG